MTATKLAFKGALSSRLRPFAPVSLRLISQRAEAIPSIHLQRPLDEKHLPFDKIPGPQGRPSTAVAFYRQSEGFRKFHKLVVKLFDEYCPIFKEHVTEKTPVVHIMEPKDFETVFRAEGKFPRRIELYFLEEYGRRRGRRPELASLLVLYFLCCTLG